MTPAEITRIEEMRAMVHKHCPALVPVIADLHRQELIRGWRDVQSVLVEGPPRPRNCITADIYLENSAAMNMNRGAT